MQPIDVHSPRIIRRRPRRPIIQFHVKTAVILVAEIAAVAAICRFDVISVIGGIACLFAIFIFAEDLWPQLPR